MNSQKYNKDELYPEDFTDDDKLNFDLLLEQSKALFPHLVNEIWLLKIGIIAYKRKEKRGGEIEKLSQEEIEEIKRKYNNDTVLYTEPSDEPPKEPSNYIMIETKTE